MRDLTKLDSYLTTGVELVRVENETIELAWGTYYNQTQMGYFIITIGGISFRVIAKALEEWEHVTVLPRGVSRCPTWEEMEVVKRLFFHPSEAAMQLHVPVYEHLNTSSHLLHLWRPRLVEIPRPGKELV